MMLNSEPASSFEMPCLGNIFVWETFFVWVGNLNFGVPTKYNFFCTCPCDQYDNHKKSGFIQPFNASSRTKLSVTVIKVKPVSNYSFVLLCFFNLQNTFFYGNMKKVKFKQILKMKFCEISIDILIWLQIFSLEEGGRCEHPRSLIYRGINATSYHCHFSETYANKSLKRM